MADETATWAPGDTLVAKFDYDGTGSNQNTLPFNRGDEILLKQIASRGWALGWSVPFSSSFSFFFVFFFLLSFFL
jgi:hypothetical protein